MSRDAVLRVFSNSGVLTNAHQVQLQLLLDAGIPVAFGSSRSIRLTNPLVIRTNAVLDGTSSRVVLDGGNTVRHFIVTNGAALRLVNLTLAHGHFAGADGGTGQNGSPGQGGSIYLSSGHLESIGCGFMSNAVVGGNGGTPVPLGLGAYPPTLGAAGYGGAIYLADGNFRMSDCVLAGNSATGCHGHAGDVYTAPGSDALGGAIYATNSRVHLAGVTFSNNVAKAGNLTGIRPAMEVVSPGEALLATMPAPP